MTYNACPLPGPRDADEAVQRMLQARRIAVVGISDDPSRPSHYVSEYLQRHGYGILPVNPNHQQVLGARCAGSVGELGEAPDMVLVFRRSEHCPDVTREAIAAGARGVWLQSGIRSPEAERLAREAEIAFVQDKCMMVEHRSRGMT